MTTHIHRSAKTGRLVSAAYAKRHPDTTVRERVQPPGAPAMTTKKTDAAKADAPKTHEEATATDPRGPAGEMMGDGDQPQFGEDVPTAIASKFLYDAEGKKGAAGPVDQQLFEGKDATERAQAYADSNTDDTCYWTVQEGTRAHAIDEAHASRKD